MHKVRVIHAPIKGTQLQLHKSVNQGIEVTDNFLCELKPQILIKACVRLS